jgi:tRNA threonylcarbamoyladenosine biosynthesis protein TsaB
MSTLVLAIETATPDTEVAVADERGPLAEIAVRRGRRHVESLHPAIERACGDAGVALCDLTAIGVDVGPGLFTGLRVGVAAAKTLAYFLGIPLVAATSLEVLGAAAAPFAGGDTLGVPVVDMRRGEVAWRIAGAVRVGPPGDLGVALAALRVVDVLLVGDGAAARGAEIAAAADRVAASGAEIAAGADRVATSGAVIAGGPRIRVAGAALAAPPARVLAAVTAERLAAGATDDPLACVPLYLREADAAIHWESRPMVETR